MKNFKKYMIAALCLAMAAGLSGCTENTELESSSQPESSAVSEVSSAPEEEVSSTFIPANDLISTASEVIDGATEGFEYEFSQNPIDKQYDEDYSLATSFSMMRQACGDAAKRWNNMVDIAYEAALAATPEDERYILIEEQEQWLSDLSIRLDSIRDNADDDNEGILAAEKETVLVYRTRAMELCRIKYELDGTLPNFSTEDDLEAAG